MAISKRDLENIDVIYERVGEVFDHTENEMHICATCERPSDSEFCSPQCFEMRFY